MLITDMNQWLWYSAACMNPHRTTVTRYLPRENAPVLRQYGEGTWFFHFGVGVLCVSISGHCCFFFFLPPPRLPLEHLLYFFSTSSSRHRSYPFAYSSSLRRSLVNIYL
ncbi:hypothetical protein ASPZODRAFT_780052 [Penicilliopsis zonata CBS 506.65]|uniref:Uncharacterized protein n=1 Tax=Penicilliopsis zonata CBS 506.65 TaxID=1073090 RepID=A0A1L9SB32_9EURO|nr:hypothetical protein ASPZODRAFT_780052 [Penicilliopsis zonata CBS 506.65]OJJ44361.1 hypothetical protein ASPZODRAFT_780052 [Penicilliopsis zonata CBS 506.65]